MDKQNITLGHLFAEYIDNLNDSDGFDIWRNYCVTGIKEDSRQIEPGDLFIARNGEHFKGGDYIQAAIAKGAVAVLIEQPFAETSNTGAAVDNSAYSAPVFAVKRLNFKLGEIASKIYLEVVNKLNIIGITGTNGKTSCAHYLAQALNSLGVNTFIIGTLGNGHPDDLQQASHTTPDACSLHQLFAQFYAQGACVVVMEVSSHALEQGRVQGVPFNLVAYTNLSQDHLDYHGTMQAYAEAKAKLFTEFNANYCVLNADDEFNRQLYDRLADNNLHNSYKLYNYSEQHAADAVARDIDLQQGLAFELTLQEGAINIKTALIGKFNVANLMLCATSLYALGYSLEQIKQALSALKPVPGRMQKVGLPSNSSLPLCVVDYAHTPDALEKALQACRVHTKGQLFVVFGCGGDRDQSKRVLMANIAERFADQLVITSDNPRTENPETIIQMIETGLSSGLNYCIDRDRKSAIKKAISVAKNEDVVLIAGKGHEDYQDIMGVKHRFLDAQIVLEALVEQTKLGEELSGELNA